MYLKINLSFPPLVKSSLKLSLFFQPPPAPQVHLDASLLINNLIVRIGDNVEIKCDIDSPPHATFIWKRFGYDLSLVNNSTDDDDDELKLMSDGCLYITNVQMRHSGNYTCQSSVEPQVGNFKEILIIC